MKRNGLGMLQALLQARKEATEKFGPLSEWDRDFVAKWMARRVQELTGQASELPPSYVDRERE